MFVTDEMIQCCLKRRKTLAKTLQNGLLLIPTAEQPIRNGDVHHLFRPDSNFYYLTGFDEPNALLALQIVEGILHRSILFCQTKNIDKEIWDGKRYGLETAKERFCLDETLDIQDVDLHLPKLLVNMPCLFYPFSLPASWHQRIVQATGHLAAQKSMRGKTPNRFEDVSPILATLRLIKDPLEIDLMRQAAKISAHAHKKLMQQTQPASHEYQLEASLLYDFRQAGAVGAAYPSIVASGPTACILHSVRNDRLIAEHELVLIDAGCEWQYYASDITRTWPVGGQFSTAQKALYQLVLSAQMAAIDAIAPGQAASGPHEKAVSVLTQGLIDLGLIQDTFENSLDQKLYRRFFMHNSSHWIGLDVHDAGPALTETTLTAGQVLTVEPGLYCPDHDDIPKAFRGIGIRIEDEILVTEKGHENLTVDAPKTMDDLSRLIGQS